MNNKTATISSNTKYLIFDFDGTIADTLDEMIEVFNELAS